MVAEIARLTQDREWQGGNQINYPDFFQRNREIFDTLSRTAASNRACRALDSARGGLRAGLLNPEKQDEPAGAKRDRPAEAVRNPNNAGQTGSVQRTWMYFRVSEVAVVCSAYRVPAYTGTY